MKKQGFEMVKKWGGAGLFGLTIIIATAVEAQKEEIPALELTDMEQIAIAAAKFREFATSDFNKAVELFERRNCLDFITKSKSFKEAPVVWSYFFNSTLVMAGNTKGNRPVYAYYNPFQNALLLTQWEMSRGEPALSWADLQMASTFVAHEAGLPDNPIPWMVKSRDHLATNVLAEASKNVVTAFEERFPPLGTSGKKLKTQRGVSDVVDFIGSQSALVLQNILDVQNSKSQNYNPALLQFVTAVKQGRVEVLEEMLKNAEGMDADLVMEIPKPVRERMVPVYVLSDNGNTIAMISSASNPKLYLFCAYAAEPVQRLAAAGVGGFIVP